MGGSGNNGGGGIFDTVESKNFKKFKNIEKNYNVLKICKEILWVFENFIEMFAKI